MLGGSSRLTTLCPNLLYRCCFTCDFFQGQADSTQSRKRSVENGNSLAVADTATLSDSAPSISDFTAQYHTNRKQQLSLDAHVLAKTPSTVGSRILSAAVSGDTEYGDYTVNVRDAESNYAADAVSNITSHSKDDGIVCHTVSAAEATRRNTHHSKGNGSNFAADATQSSILHSNDAGTVRERDRESNYAAEITRRNTLRSTDTGNNFSTEAVASSILRSINSSTVCEHDTESNHAAIVSSSTHGDGGNVHDTGKSCVAAADDDAAVISSQCNTPAETTFMPTHIFTAADHAAVRMHNSTESHDEPGGNLENSVQSANVNGEFR